MNDVVALRELDEAGLRELLEVAVADAEPDETMPHLPGHPTWTRERRDGFLAFFGPMLGSLDTVIFGIIVAGRMAGFTRLKIVEPPGTAETGMWLGRSYRGKGIGAAAFEAVLKEAAARGFKRVVADTQPDNAAAQGVLRAGRAKMLRKDDKIYAEITIDPAYAPDLDK